MLKKFTLVIGFIGLGLFSSAQGEAPLSIGEKQLNFGVGFGRGVPVYAGVDFAVHNDITVGPQIAFNLGDFDYMVFAGRGDYHWNRLLNIPSEWDFYAGMNIGFFSYFGDGEDYTSGLDLGLQIGGRWYWSDKWGLNLEFNGGMLDNSSGGAHFGLSMKL